MSYLDEKKSAEPKLSELTTIIMVALAASALLGLAAGLVFRVWVNLIIAPIVAIGSALAFAFHGSGFLRGVLVTFGCLVASQVAYLVGLFMAPADDLAEHLADDEPDDQPGQSSEQCICDEDQEQDGQNPPGPLPPET